MTRCSATGDFAMQCECGEIHAVSAEDLDFELFEQRRYRHLDNGALAGRGHVERGYSAQWQHACGRCSRPLELVIDIWELPPGVLDLWEPIARAGKLIQQPDELRVAFPRHAPG